MRALKNEVLFIKEIAKPSKNGENFRHLIGNLLDEI